MRKVDQLIERCGESHRNPTNKGVHWICVPVIMWCVLALFWAYSPYAAYVFIGHAIEGRKPSFFEDVKFPLVGPAWVPAFVYRRAGIGY